MRGRFVSEDVARTFREGIRMKAPKTASLKVARPYHHGDLRQALIDATRSLVVEHGAEQFSLADACRKADVSSAAPYKHFRDKDEILREVVAQGFDAMRANTVLAAEAHPRGSIERIIAIGRLYISSAVAETGLFRLMFGQNPNVTHHPAVIDQGNSCFGFVIDEVADYCVFNAISVEPLQTATQLWTMVHGAACLLIDDHYEQALPGFDVDKMIVVASQRLLRP